MAQVLEKYQHLTNIDINAPIEAAEAFRQEASDLLDPEMRGQLGQYMTSPAISRFMASLFKKRRRNSIRLLDAGAGAGALTAAFISEICSRANKPSVLSVVAYEIDTQLAVYLEQTLQLCQRLCELKGIAFSYEIIQEDFIKAATDIGQVDLLGEPVKQFDCAILNPPYGKIRSESEHRKLLRDLGIETSNLYTGFLSVATGLLDRNGELAAITPRSFCNGPYFKHFRKFFLGEMALQHIHIFASRSAAFKDDKVLQENVVFHASKSECQPDSVVISSSHGAEILQNTMRKVRFEQVIQPHDPDLFIHIVTDDIGDQTTKKMEQLHTSLKDLGIVVSTGRVVDFRAKDYLRLEPENNTVPLIYPRNFSNGLVEWPVPNGKKHKALLDVSETESLLVPSGIYVLIKRFSSKEERRRVVAAIYDPEYVSAPRVGFENHLNYYHINGEGLSQHVALGLATYLNSTLVDTYFRLFNGHTQVNATDLRRLPYPTIDQLKEIGKRVGKRLPNQEDTDAIVDDILYC